MLGHLQPRTFIHYGYDLLRMLPYRYIYNISPVRDGSLELSLKETLRISKINSRSSGRKYFQESSLHFALGVRGDSHARWGNRVLPENLLTEARRCLAALHLVLGWPKGLQLSKRPVVKPHLEYLRTSTFVRFICLTEARRCLSTLHLVLDRLEASEGLIWPLGRLSTFSLLLYRFSREVDFFSKPHYLSYI